MTEMMTKEQIIEILEKKMYVKAISTGVDSWDRHIIEHRVKGHQEAATAIEVHFKQLLAEKDKKIAELEQEQQYINKYFADRELDGVLKTVYKMAQKDIDQKAKIAELKTKLGLQ